RARDAHLPAHPVRRSRRGSEDTRGGSAGAAGAAPRAGRMMMGLEFKPGAEIDGFRIGPLVHTGGLATIWRVTRAAPERDSGPPLIMKVPRLGFGEPAGTLTCFEVEQMLLAILRGEHVPRYIAAGDVTRQPYLVME